MSNDTSRADQIAAVRRMLDWLEAHPDVPVGPYSLSVRNHVLADDDVSGLASLTVIAEAAGAQVAPGDGSFEVVVPFGHVEYTAIYVARASMSEYRALMSYSGRVTPP